MAVAPTYESLPDPIHGFPLNHACGTAVDSEGDIYVSNAGESKVEVFDPAGTHLQSIANGNEPCGLAVDSKGNLYVSEQSTGNVVRYAPNTYPFSGSPIYGPPTTIDPSANAKSIAVDPFDDRLYVAEGNRIVTYSSEGTPGIDEEQLIKIRDEGGTLTFSFEGSSCAPIPTSASHAQMETCLKEILGEGNFFLVEGPVVEGLKNRYRVEFRGTLAGKDVPLLVADTSAMLGFKEVLITQAVEGWGGHIAEGELSGATGVAAYTYRGAEHYVFAAEPSQGKIGVLGGSDIRAFAPRATIDGSETPAGELGLAEDAYLGLDPKNGHLFAYDATHKVLNEFEASGHYFTRIESPESPAFADAKPTAIAVNRSGGAHEGTIYVTAGASTGARLLAFGRLPDPSRRTLPEPPAEKFTAACGTTVDSFGDIYVAGETAIRVYGPEPALKEGVPQPLAKIEDANKPCDLAVDSEGNLYTANRGLNPACCGDESVARYEPSANPPVEGTTYTEKSPIETLEDPQGIAVNSADDHLFVVHNTGIREYDSAAKASGPLKAAVCGLSGELFGIDVYGAKDEVYVVQGSRITVCDPVESKVLVRIDGSGSPGGLFSGFGGLIGIRIAVDQANGHVLVGEMTTRGTVEEYEASGAFVAEFGPFTKIQTHSDVAVDNACALHEPPLSEETTPTCDEFDPNDGNLYAAYLNDLTAFGPLAYGVPPFAVTGTATEVGGESATLNATVNPRGFELTECRFEYLSEAEYEANGETFAGAESKPCDKSPEKIGKGTKPVAVKAQLSGLEPAGRYRFRLFAENPYGTSEDEEEGEAGLFGPPLVITDPALPVLYHEATLRGRIDPAGLVTKYHFEYGTSEEYDHSTPVVELLGSTGGYVSIKVPIFGLQEGATYHFRLVAENDDAPGEGIDRSFATLNKPPVPPCPNATLRLENNSSRLPDCRAYELVTPADTRGAPPRGIEIADFNHWLVTPRGALAGGSLAFFLDTTLPSTEGNGFTDGFRATRGEAGWSSHLFGPTFTQNGSKSANPHGIASDQLYSLWNVGVGPLPGSLPAGEYLRTPEGSSKPSPHCAVEVEPEGRFESIGCGSLGTDLHAEGRYISSGGEHVIFESKAQLEPAGPESPLKAVYDRSPGGPTHVVSLLPSGEAPEADATYLGATPDGSSIVFSVKDRLYLRRNDTETLEVTSTPASFAGLSDDGSRLFYTNSADPKASAALYAFDRESQSATEIASNARFVDVSADGSHAYYTKEGNLYLWDGAGTTFIATLDPKDLQAGTPPRFPGTFNDEFVALDAWTAECVVKRDPMGPEGRAVCPSRTTPDGRFLVFQSHADLTPPYEGQGHSEIYRYDAIEESLVCVSCDPSGAVATAEVDLQTYGTGIPQTTLIPGISDDGSEVFFQTTAALLPEDANSVLDVYAWQAEGTGGCARPQGCLALISSGQSDGPSYIYSITPDGHDVFFTTTEKLIPSDITGSPSIYDARVEGGFPVTVEKEPCHGDACQPLPGPTPERSTMTSGVPNSGNAVEPTAGRCPKGRRAVKEKGRTRCLKRRHHHRKHKRARHPRRAGR